MAFFSVSLTSLGCCHHLRLQCCGLPFDAAPPSRSRRVSVAIKSVSPLPSRHLLAAQHVVWPSLDRLDRPRRERPQRNQPDADRRGRQVLLRRRRGSGFKGSMAQPCFPTSTIVTSRPISICVRSAPRMLGATPARDELDVVVADGIIKVQISSQPIPADRGDRSRVPLFHFQCLAVFRDGWLAGAVCGPPSAIAPPRGAMQP
jgi:hypothetical protein